jgi:UDP-glucose 4-epimerase
MTPNSINDLITVTEKITGKPLPIKAFDRRAGDVDYMVSGGSTLHNLTGWKPLQSSIEEIMRSQIEWERSKYWEQI